MTKLAEIQAAIAQLDGPDQQRLRLWLDEAPLDLEEDSPELEAELLKAVQGPHAPPHRGELEARNKNKTSFLSRSLEAPNLPPPW